jgi:hypothetical protein
MRDPTALGPLSGSMTPILIVAGDDPHAAPQRTKTSSSTLAHAEDVLIAAQ